MIVILNGISGRDTLQSWTMMVSNVGINGQEVLMIAGVFV